MKFRSIAAAIGCAALTGAVAAKADGGDARRASARPTGLVVAQNDAGSAAPTPSTGPVPTPANPGSAPLPGFGQAAPKPPVDQGAANGAVKPAAGAKSQTPPAAVTGARRNDPALGSTSGRHGAGPQTGTASSIPFGGPQSDVQPTPGSPMRDSGAGNGGVPVYSSAPATLGGPINGTANAYTSTLPNGSAPNGYISNNQGTAAAASRNPETNANGYTRQPLGGAPTTRDQFGTYGGRAGYNAQGVYNGTAAQSGTGIGYGSAYATTGRPTGGLLSNNVDATGPLRPYIPQNGGTIVQPNSGYGIPNGSRPSHMDGRGIQRIN